MSSVKIVLEKGRKYKEGSYPIVVQLLHKRKKKSIYIGYGATESSFDKSTGKLLYVKNGGYDRKTVKYINEIANDIKQNLLFIIEQLKVKNDNFTVNDIILQYSPNCLNRYLYKYFENQISMLKSADKIGTANAYYWTLISLIKTMGDKDILLSDLSITYVREYLQKLNESNLSKNSIGFYIHNFHALYNKAIDNGIIIGNNIFRGIKIQYIQTSKRALSRNNMLKIASVNLSGNPRLELARDLFMFSFYTRGMSFVDIVHLKSSDIKDGVICYHRNKTSQLIQVSLTSQISQIIERYNNSTPYVFGLLKGENSQEMYKSYKSVFYIVNRSLKSLASKLEFDTPLTSYCARHSWATCAKEIGAPISVISEGLGHTSERTTAIYLKKFDLSVIDELNNKVSKLDI